MYQEDFWMNSTDIFLIVFFTRNHQYAYTNKQKKGGIFVLHCEFFFIFKELIPVEKQYIHIISIYCE